jgi:hypothetical protein
LVITAGWYRLISYVINVVRLEPEPWASRFPAATREVADDGDTQGGNTSGVA